MNPPQQITSKANIKVLKHITYSLQKLVFFYFVFLSLRLSDFNEAQQEVTTYLH